MNDLAVLIPVFNDQAALLETLESIEEPDVSFTVVVVDDGSDEPISVDPEKYPFRVVLLRQDPNGGIVRALNTGLEFILREGFTYIARLDAADLHRPYRLKTQYDRLTENESVFMVGSNVAFRDEKSGHVLFTTCLPLSSKDIRRWMAFRNCFIHPAVMFRASVLSQTGLYDAQYPHIEDYVLFSRIVERFPCENIPEPLVDCYIRKGGISLRHHRRQLVSGIRFKFRHPRPADPLWYAYLLKRFSFLFLPHCIRRRLKAWLGFISGTRSHRKSLATAGGKA